MKLPSSTITLQKIVFIEVYGPWRGNSWCPVNGDSIIDYSPKIKRQDKGQIGLLIIYNKQLVEDNE